MYRLQAIFPRRPYDNKPMIFLRGSPRRKASSYFARRRRFACVRSSVSRARAERARFLLSLQCLRVSAPTLQVVHFGQGRGGTNISSDLKKDDLNRVGAWVIVRNMLQQVWPKEQPALKARVVGAVGLLVGSKVKRMIVLEKLIS